MIFGQGDFRFKVQENWEQLPAGWSFGWIPAVAVNSRDQVFVYSRSEHPLVIFDREGNFVNSWGDEVLKDAHGIFIDANDTVFCVEREIHCMHKFNSAGELQMTLGTPDQPGAEGEPFNLPTDIAFDSKGFMYISDGYGNNRLHKFTAAGEWVKSWGELGDGPGQFNLPHCVRVDRHDRVLVADRNNNRIQFFDTEGNYLQEWTGFAEPDTIFIDRNDIVYVADLGGWVRILTLAGEKLSEWGRGIRSDVPGEFRGCPHGIWADSQGDLYVSEVQPGARLQKFIRQ